MLMFVLSHLAEPKKSASTFTLETSIVLGNSRVLYLFSAMHSSLTYRHLFSSAHKQHLIILFASALPTCVSLLGSYFQCLITKQYIEQILLYSQRGMATY